MSGWLKKQKNSIRKRYNRWTRVRFDKTTGFYRIERFGKPVYIRHPSHMSYDEDVLWSCEKLFFHHYMPKDGDIVVDLGAGYGDEALYVAERAPRVTYYGVEAQPVIYECLANTFRWAGDGFIASPYAITESDTMRFASHYAYAAVGKQPEGYIDVPMLKWREFIDKYGITAIDLLKMNIEGAERDILDAIDDFSIVKRFIISCHDFRANSGDGEWFRTREFVTEKLTGQGYRIKPFHYGIDFADDWVYAERQDLD